METPQTKVQWNGEKFVVSHLPPQIPDHVREQLQNPGCCNDNSNFWAQHFSFNTLTLLHLTVNCYILTLLWEMCINIHSISFKLGSWSIKMWPISLCFVFFIWERQHPSTEKHNLIHLFHYHNSCFPLLTKINIL